MSREYVDAISQDVMNQSVDQLHKLKDLLLALAKLSEAINNGEYSNEHLEKLSAYLNRFLFAIRNLSLNEEIQVNVEKLKLSIDLFSQLDKEKDDILVIKSEMNKIIVFLKQILPMIITVVNDIDEKEQALWYIDEHKKAIILKFKDSKENFELIQKFGDLTTKLISLDNDYLDDTISEDRFNLIRPIIISKLSYLMSKIIKISYE